MKITDLQRYVILSAAPLPFVDGKVPEDFCVFEYGKTFFTKEDKTDFYVFSEADADNLIAEFARKGVDILIDYEHQILRSVFNGKEVPAAGWGIKLYKKPDGLWCSASWTPKARRYLENGEYKYISQVFKTSRTGKNITSLFNITLSNKPATDNQRSLIAADEFTASFNESETNPKPKKESKMNEILLLLGLTALADSDDQAAINGGIKTEVQKLLDGKKATDDFLALHDADSLDVVTAKIGQMVPASEKIELEGKIKQRDANDAVQLVLSECKITKEQVPKALKFALNDLDSFKDYYKDAPPITPDNNGINDLDEPNGDKGGNGGDGGDNDLTALSDVDLEYCRKHGYDPEAFLKAKKKK